VWVTGQALMALARKPLPLAAVARRAAPARRPAAAPPPRALCLRVDAARLHAAVIEELRDLFERYPGDSDFVLEMDTRAGLRRLRFGQEYRVAARNAALGAELRRLLGPALAAPPPAAVDEAVTVGEPQPEAEPAVA
jgi:DNA polymerase-3 subunit alpha